VYLAVPDLGRLLRRSNCAMSNSSFFRESALIALATLLLHCRG
jgi:hypothetical protein